LQPIKVPCRDKQAWGVRTQLWENLWVNDKIKSDRPYTVVINRKLANRKKKKREKKKKDI